MSLFTLIIISFSSLSFLSFLQIIWEYKKQKVEIPSNQLVWVTSLYFLTTGIGSWILSELLIWVVYSVLFAEQRSMIASGFPIVLVIFAILFCFSIAFSVVQKYILKIDDKAASHRTTSHVCFLLFVGIVFFFALILLL